MHGTNTRVNTVKITMKRLIYTLTGHFVHVQAMARKRRHVDGMSGKTAGNKPKWTCLVSHNLGVAGRGVVGGGGGEGGLGRWVRTIPSPKREHNVQNDAKGSKTVITK